MADSTTAVASDSTLTPQQPESENQAPQPGSPFTPFPNPNPLPSTIFAPPPPLIQPSFRPAVAPQFSALPTYQTPVLPPPGVGAVSPMMMASTPAVASGAPAQVPGVSVQQVIASPYSLAAQQLRYPLPVPNSYPQIPQHLPQGAIPPPGVIRYPSPYAPLMRPAFPPRPMVGMMPPHARPPFTGIRVPMIPPIVKPLVIPSAGALERPQTTVYVGKISQTVDNDFMLSLLQLCGPVKSWKRVQDPTNGTLKGFGFCEFELAEGVLRALRLLSKLNVDGQELLLNVKQATREYLELYVEKKIESAKNNQETESGCAEKEESTDLTPEKDETVKSNEESLKSSDDEKKDGEKLNRENPDATNFGIVTDEDKEADREALEKLNGMIEERLKNNPLPPPPHPPQTAIDGPGNSTSQQPSGSKDIESDTNVTKHYLEDKNDDEKTAESKLSNESEKNEIGSPDRSRRHDKSKDRDRREKERELERYEREREQERAKREKDREYRSREEERGYKLREKDWETREREKEHWRKREREKEKEKYQERRWGILDQEHESDDGYGKKRRYKTSDEERKRRQREREDDLADRIREEEEITEAKLQAEEELRKNQDAQIKFIGQPANGHERSHFSNDTYFDEQGTVVDQTSDVFPNQGVNEGEGIMQNGISDELVNAATDERMNNNAPIRKLGFGLSGSGKRASVPSVFNQDEDEDAHTHAHKEKKMRPLVPIDYSIEEKQAGQLSVSEVPSTNTVDAADHVKRNTSVNPKEERNSLEKEKSRRYHEKSGQRDRGRHDEETNARDEGRKDTLDREKANKLRTPENQKLLDAKQLIDTIPKTKDELFSYDINWVIYEQNQLHERMRPWISKKITDFLGEEEVTLVDYIVSSTQEHVGADDMLERLQAILDDEAEMFVLKMWRMLIFEIKKVETGLSLRSKT